MSQHLPFVQHLLVQLPREKRATKLLKANGAILLLWKVRDRQPATDQRLHDDDGIPSRDKLSPRYGCPPVFLYHDGRFEPQLFPCQQGSFEVPSYDEAPPEFLYANCSLPMFPEMILGQVCSDQRLDLDDSWSCNLKLLLNDKSFPVFLENHGSSITNIFSFLKDCTVSSSGKNALPDLLNVDCWANSVTGNSC